VDVKEGLLNVMSIKAELLDGLGKELSGILDEGALFLSNKVENFLDSFDISGFVGGLVSPFDGVSDELGSTFDNIHNFVSGFSACFDTGDDSHWVNEVLDAKLGISELHLLSSQVHDGSLELVWVDHAVELHESLEGLWGDHWLLLG
jgi:hypothetical protein